VTIPVFMDAELAASMQQPMSGNKIRWGGTADGGRMPKKKEKKGVADTGFACIR